MHHTCKLRITWRSDLDSAVPYPHNGFRTYLLPSFLAMSNSKPISNKYVQHKASACMPYSYYVVLDNTPQVLDNTPVSHKGGAGLAFRHYLDRPDYCSMCRMSQHVPYHACTHACIAEHA